MLATWVCMHKALVSAPVGGAMLVTVGLSGCKESRLALSK